MAASEQDPGVQGKKLSKSGWDDSSLTLRNLSYMKVLDLQIRYIRARQEGLFDDIEPRKAKWLAKSEWHERTYGW